MREENRIEPRHAAVQQLRYEPRATEVRRHGIERPTPVHEHRSALPTQEDRVSLSHVERLDGKARLGPAGTAPESEREKQSRRAQKRARPEPWGSDAESAHGQQRAHENDGPERRRRPQKSDPSGA